MRNGPNARSSDGIYADLDDVRRLSRRLAGVSVMPPRPRAPAPAPVPAPMVAPVPDDIPVVAMPDIMPSTSTAAALHGYGPSSTEALLSRAITLIGAAGGCIVDAQGLLVAHQGLAAEVAQSLGGRLLLALDQVARLGSNELLVVTSAVKGHWVSGVRLRGAEALAIGLVGQRPLGPEHQGPITALLGSVSLPPTGAAP
jgi:hypothetical protein